ncbi:MAG: hypothetical protein IH944_12990 [Armatimonadetes bacterium]|nr:hypothetical protein [Armatimonadota bacterium]
MIAAIALVAAATQWQTVTFTHPCAHSSIVLEAFGKQIGETIKPSGGVNKDYFLVRFDEMPIEDAKAAIAKTLNATWSRKGDVLYLTRTRAQELAEENAINEELKRSLQLRIDGAIKRNRDRKPLVLVEVIEEMRNQTSPKPFGGYTYNESPLRRFEDRVEATLTVDDLMSLPLGSTIYSDDPRLEERPFPPAWMDAAKAFRQDREVWYRAQQVSGLTDENSFGLNYPGSLVHKIELEFNRKPDSLGISISFRAGIRSLSSDFSGGSGIVSSENEWPDFYRGLDEPLEIGKDMKEAWNYFVPRGWVFAGRRNPRVMTRKELPRLLAQVIDDLPNNEPLTSLVSWPILQAAERKKTNIVALFADGVLHWPFRQSVEDGMTLSSVFGFGWNIFMATFDTELSCWIARPFDPAGARKNRMDRPAFATLLKRARADGWIRLNNMAGFIRRTEIETLEPSWQTWLGIAEFLGEDDWSWPGVFSRGGNGTAVYARLSTSQQRAAWSGGIEIPLSLWPSGVWEVLATSDWGRARMIPAGLDMSSLEAQQGRRVSSLFGERLPAGTTLRVQVVEGTELWVGYEKTGFQMDLERYANISVNPDYDGLSDQKVDRVAVGPTETLTVELVVPNVGSVVMTARYGRVPFFDELGPVEQLPASAQAAIAAAIQKARGGSRTSYN